MRISKTPRDSQKYLLSEHLSGYVSHCPKPVVINLIKFTEVGLTASPRSENTLGEAELLSCEEECQFVPRSFLILEPDLLTVVLYGFLIILHCPEQATWAGASQR